MSVIQNSRTDEFATFHAQVSQKFSKNRQKHIADGSFGWMRGT
jgi:hypothetical protein